MTKNSDYKKEREKKRLEQRRKAKIENDPPNITENGKRIRHFMLENKVRGNYKDFVIISDTMLIDSMGSYPLPTNFEGVALVHKRNLAKLLDPKIAAKFWHPRLGRVGAFIKPGTKKSLH